MLYLSDMRFAQISDLHFGSFTINPIQFFSKRWVGNFNHFLNRKKQFFHESLPEIVPFLKKNGISHVFVTGDLSATSRTKEFKRAKEFLNLLQKEGFSVFTIPGNHDQYTKQSYKKRKFYRYFQEKYDKNCIYSLKENKVTYTSLEKGLWLVAMDTAVATSWNSSQGLFSEKMAEDLDQILRAIPSKDKIILMNHYPFFQQYSFDLLLMGGNLLKKTIQKYPNVFLYLHGHTHQRILADLRESFLPILSDCGATPHKESGACHLFDLKENILDVSVYCYQEGWHKTENHSFLL